MFITSIFLWFRLGIGKAFKDVFIYGVKAKWPTDKDFRNRTMPLKLSKQLSSSLQKQTKSNQKDIEETVFLKNCYSEYKASSLNTIEETDFKKGG